MEWKEVRLVYVVSFLLAAQPDWRETTVIRTVNNDAFRQVEMSMVYYRFMVRLTVYMRSVHLRGKRRRMRSLRCNRLSDEIIPCLYVRSYQKKYWRCASFCAGVTAVKIFSPVYG